MTVEIVLLPAAAEDFDGYYEIKSGDGDIFWMGFAGAPDREILRKCFLERLGDVGAARPGDKIIYVVKPADGGGVLGYVQFTGFEDFVEIAISVGGRSRGAGVGRAAVKAALKLLAPLGKKTVARIRDDNVASQKCFLANGFSRTERYENVNYPRSGEVKLRTYVFE